MIPFWIWLAYWKAYQFRKDKLWTYALTAEVKELFWAFVVFWFDDCEAYELIKVQIRLPCQHNFIAGADYLQNLENDLHNFQIAFLSVIKSLFEEHKKVDMALL